MSKSDVPRLEWSKKAIQDLASIERFITLVFSEETARKSLLGIRNKMKATCKHPESCPKDPYFAKLPNNIRYTKFKRSRITFEVLEDRIVVLRILDARQNPFTFTP